MITVPGGRGKGGGDTRGKGVPGGRGEGGGRKWEEGRGKWQGGRGEYWYIWEGTKVIVEGLVAS